MSHGSSAAPSSNPGDARPSFQARVGAWVQACFGTGSPRSGEEIGDRFLEEVLELLQSHGYDRDRVSVITNYVYGRPVGESPQEAGGVMVSFAAYGNAHRLDLQECGEIELTRIESRIDEIRERHARKRDIADLVRATRPPEGTT